MEIGSQEHRHLLNQALIKTALRQLLMGGGIAIILMLPSLLRENAFSHGLKLVGLGVLAVTILYVTVMGWRKYRLTLGKLPNPPHTPDPKS